MGLGFKTPKEAIEGEQPELILLAYRTLHVAAMAQDVGWAIFVSP